MNSYHSYYSVLNKYSVYDAERLAPSLRKIQDIVHGFYKSLKSSEKLKKQDLKEFLIHQVYTKDTPLLAALHEFVDASDAYPVNFAHSKKLPEDARVFPAIVALNSLYDAIKEGESVENVVQYMYLKGYFADILQYVKHLHENNNNDTPSNTNSQRTLSIGSVVNASSQVSGNSAISEISTGIAGPLHTPNNNAWFAEGAFGPMNAGGGKQHYTRKRKGNKRKYAKSRKH